jgi:homogentisate solanesyltransferase
MSRSGLVLAALVGAAWHLQGASAFMLGVPGPRAGPAWGAGIRRGSRPVEVPLRMARGRARRPEHATRMAQAGAGDSSMLGALYKFTRPHTIRGTILASCACVTRVMLKSIQTQSVIEWKLLQTAFYGLVALLCGNAYIVGINQIYDVEIDRVNKPFLPVAAGEISAPLAWALVGGSGVLGLAITAAFFSPLILQLYCVGMFLGTVYTVPPFRWKNNYFLAAFSIAMVRGLLLNVGLHHAASTALGLAISWPAQVCFIAAFMTVFALVIAVAKDLPDVAGDIQYGVKTVASSLGVAKAANVVTLILMCVHTHIQCNIIFIYSHVYIRNSC